MPLAVLNNLTLGELELASFEEVKISQEIFGAKEASHFSILLYP